MKKIIPALYAVGAVMILTGAITFITKWPFAPYIYTIGATLFALAQINTPYEGANKNVKRLRRQQILGALFLVAAGAFMFFTNKNEWIVVLTIGAVIELYTSFRIPQEEQKDL
ncbi:hypothetical protein [Bacteroides sp. 224]|uniref:hypothetical protein n=1 Tax=Bacteroides sp. 224 TaxID=2302936 RepID=UPI0013D7805C|nr:hypothetical protein [Bacteroides sp. 224]NDV66936.1 hypothetical protein [Bacteroides sp. 224]